MLTELLAPAKDKNTAFAAIDCGADAVYIGANLYGARKKASNSIEDIKEVVNYAHKFWAKVFVTMNTILNNSELDDAVEIAKDLSNIGIDGLIVQDLGLLNELLKIGYKTPIHMSTQCDNFLPEKIKFFNEIGVSRVVLARELSIEQIKNIHKENPNLELEAFVHGALCVSMSGQCYLSQYIGGRSANRGECAQPCRKKYSVETIDGKVLAKDIHALCLKDFNASNKLEELKDAGIYSFKIEGRLKDTSYVKNIVAYYRNKLGKGTSSGKSFFAFTPNPEKSFNRGFTEYFLNKREKCFNFESPKSQGEYLGKVVKIEKECFKIKTDKVISVQDGLFFNGDGCSVNKIVDNFIYPNKKLKLKIGDKIYRNYDVIFEKQIEKPVKRQIKINIIIDKNITIIDEDGVRIVYPIPSGEKANNSEKNRENFIKQLSKTGESEFYINKIEINTELPFLAISSINELRRKMFEDLMSKRIETYNKEKKEVQKPIKYTEYFVKEVDYRANIHNNSAKEFYEKCGTKVIDFSFESQKSPQNTKLMSCKHCIKYALDICKSPLKLRLRDEYNNIYPLNFDCKNCEMSVMQPNQKI